MPFPSLTLYPSGTTYPGFSSTTVGGVELTSYHRTHEPVWKFELADSRDMSLIAELRQASSRTLTLGLNRPGGCSFSIPMSAPAAAHVTVVETCVIASKRGTPVWSGPVWTINEVGPTPGGAGAAGRLEVQCVGWFELLNHVLMKEKWGVSVLVNGDFDDETSWSSSSAVTAGPGGAALVASTDTIFPGSAGHQFTASGGGAVAAEIIHQQTLTTRVGAQYRIRALMYPTTSDATAAGALDTPTSVVQLRVDGVEVLTTTWASLIYRDWQILTGYFTATATSHIISFRTAVGLVTTGKTATVQWEYVYVEPYKFSFEEDIGLIAQKLVTSAGTVIEAGTTEPSWSRKIAYQQFANTGEEIQRMSDVENGFDWHIDPLSRQFQVFWPRRGSARAQPHSIYNAHDLANATHLWKFDGTGTDEMGIVDMGLWGGATYTTALTTNDAVTGQAFDTNASGYAEVNTQGVLDLRNKSFTISALIKPETLPAVGTIFASSVQALAEGLVFFAVTSTGALQAGFYSTSVSSAAGLIVAAQTYHVVFSYSDHVNTTGEGRLYINGALVATSATTAFGPMTSALGAASALTRIGATYDPATALNKWNFDGVIDEVAVWSGRSLGQSEVKALYQTYVRPARPQGPRFGFGENTVRNVAGFNRTTDTSWLANFVVGQGRDQTTDLIGYAADIRSYVRYGPFDTVVQLGELDGIIGRSIIGAMVNAEVAIRGRPRQLVQWTPRPWTPRGNVPDPIVDYDIGDTVTLDINSGSVQIRDYPVRVFGMTIAIDENGAERVTSLQGTAGN